ncbi:MAG: peptidase [Calditrichaeota bacterium]|nr:MAG: peptidase [Calditrichota bacterium]
MLAVLCLGCARKEGTVIKDYADIGYVRSQLGKLAPVEIAYDESLLSPANRLVLKKLVQAAKLMDEIFLRQVYHKNVAIRQALKTGKNPDYPTLLEYFTVNFGPFDRLNHDEPFINLEEKKPLGANFYPADMTREEFETFLATLSDEEREAFTSTVTLIRRKNGRLVAIPYSEAYREFLEPAARLLKEAAQLAENPSLKKFLNSRAEAFLSNDYFQSDMDWMDLKDHTIEVVIGPYEVYEDGLFGYKASFEAFVTLVDPAESKKLETVSRYLVDMEKHLPIPDEHKNLNRGTASPIVVVQEVYVGGDSKAAVQTTAFNLPNDERVREAKGSKKVLLKNVAEAKYQKCWIPIVNRVLEEKDLKRVSFDAYFNHVLMHEMSHGLGPGKIVKNGRETTVNAELKETYSTIEEAKADILGLYNLDYLVQRGVFPHSLADQMYASYLGGIFRSVRFGINEAHGGANVIALNYLLEKGGFEYNEATGKFRVNDSKIRDAVRALAHDLLMIQALGDYQGAKAFIEKYRYISPQLERALDQLSDVPVDIRPRFAIEAQLNE